MQWVEAASAAKPPIMLRTASPTQRTIQHKVLIVLRLRNPALENRETE